MKVELTLTDEQCAEIVRRGTAELKRRARSNWTWGQAAALADEQGWTDWAEELREYKNVKGHKTGYDAVIRSRMKALAALMWN